MIVADNFDYLINMNEGNVGATDIPFFFLLSRPFIFTLQRHFYPEKGLFSPKKQPPAEYSTYTNSEVKLL